MRAVRFHQPGTPDVLRVEDVAEPWPGSRDVLVRVHSTSVNRVDLSLRSGELKAVTFFRLPMILGFDVAGEVISVGSAVSAFLPGDRVFAFNGLAAGADAEYVLVSQQNAAFAPQSLPLNRAGAVPLAAVTALQALRAKARVKNGASVLVHGASGGVGSFAVQLAKFFGCRVTGTSSAEKLDFVKGLGADEVLDYKQTVFDGKVGRFDAVIDAWGKLDYGVVRGSLSDEGVLVGTRPQLRSTLIGIGEKLIPSGFRNERRRYEIMMAWPNSEDLAFIARLIDSEKLRAPIDRVFRLEDLPSAHAHLESGVVCGKTVIEVVP